MKKAILFLFIIQLPFFLMAQIPNKFNYQAVVRNSDGTLMEPGIVNVSFRIVDKQVDGNIVFEETQELSINQFGMFNAEIGAMNELNLVWTETQYYLELYVNEIPISTTPLLAVPYALAAQDVVNNDDDDADPSNEIQDLKIVDNIISITGNDQATPIPLPIHGDSQWSLKGDSLTILQKNVGIGTESPQGRLVVMGDGSESESEALFEVKKSDGQTVFAIYNNGAELLVDESLSKGVKSGFAVGGYNKQTKEGNNNYLYVHPDSVRIYVDENPKTKGIKGGFAVGGYNNSKTTNANFMTLNPENYFIGHESGKNISPDGKYNSVLGYRAGENLTNGSDNIFMGYQSGHLNTSGYQNTFLGYESGYTNTGGFQNVFLGYRAGYYNTTGQNNLFLGYEAGYYNTNGNFNIFVGYRAGSRNTSGTSNLFIGEQAGRVNESGSKNLFIGTSAGFHNIDGQGNLFIGSMAGYNNVSGSTNLFIGNSAGNLNTSGFDNLFLGNAAGGSNTTGFRNVFIGYQSGAINSEGYENTILGNSAGKSLVDGKHNTFVGFEAGNRSNGSDNVYIGKWAGSYSQGSNNIFIGSGAGGGIVYDNSNTLIIDNEFSRSPEDAIIYGKMDFPRMLRLNANVGINREPLVNKLEVEGTASKSSAGDWLANSDRRIKTSIEDIENAYEVMLKLHPVKFRYTQEYLAKHPGVKDKSYYNFIAQEYEKIFPQSVQTSGEQINSDEILQMDSYNAQIVAIKAVQELIHENQKQKEQIEELYKLLEELK